MSKPLTGEKAKSTLDNILCKKELSETNNVCGYYKDNDIFVAFRNQENECFVKECENENDAIVFASNHGGNGHDEYEEKRFDDIDYISAKFDDILDDEFEALRDKLGTLFEKIMRGELSERRQVIIAQRKGFHEVIRKDKGVYLKVIDFDHENALADISEYRADLEITRDEE